MKMTTEVTFVVPISFNSIILSGLRIYQHLLKVARDSYATDRGSDTLALQLVNCKRIKVFMLLCTVAPKPSRQGLPNGEALPLPGAKRAEPNKEMCHLYFIVYLINYLHFT